jgi:hypothetical protein
MAATSNIASTATPATALVAAADFDSLTGRATGVRLSVGVKA